MPSLIAKSPLAGQQPLTLAGTTLAEVVLDRITSVAPFKGQGKPLKAALNALGLGWPEPNRFTARGGARMVWTGRDQAFLIGAAPDGLASAAALTDQSDGWACLALSGPAVEAVLARLVALDLRPEGFPTGSAARSALNHIPVLVMRAEAQRFELLVFRSMAQSAWHELASAMQAVAARAALTAT